MAKKLKAQEPKSQGPKSQAPKTKGSKAKAPKAPEQAMPDPDLGAAVHAAAEQIWLAGLGAFAKARGGATKSFEALVREGEVLQHRTRTAADGHNDKPGRNSGVTLHPAGESEPSCERLEQVFEDRVKRTLANLGVPSASDIRDLTVLLEALTDRIATLDTKPAGTTGAAVAGRARSPAKSPELPNTTKAPAASRTAAPRKP